MSLSSFLKGLFVGFVIGCTFTFCVQQANACDKVSTYECHTDKEIIMEAVPQFC
jgi:uncharacterized protein YcsI (UPF0317 family)